jgi:hypothetical protein
MDLTYFKCDLEECGKVTQGPALDEGWIEIRGRKGEFITFRTIDSEGTKTTYKAGISEADIFAPETEPTAHFCCFDCLKKWIDNMPYEIQISGSKVNF